MFYSTDFNICITIKNLRSVGERNRYFQPSPVVISKILSFKKIHFIYFFETEREKRNRRGETGRGRSRLPAEQGARCRASSQDPEIMTWAKGRHSIDWANPVPQILAFLKIEKTPAEKLSEEFGCFSLKLLNVSLRFLYWSFI